MVDDGSEAMRGIGTTDFEPRDDRVSRAAAFLVEARLRATRAPPRSLDFPPGSKPLTLMEGYACQAAARSLHARYAGRPAAYKIGATSGVAQRRFGLAEPVIGTIFESGIRRTGVGIFLLDDAEIAAECEVAVRLAVGGEAFAAAAAEPLSAVAAVSAAIELPQWRWRETLRYSAAELVADDFFSCACVLGHEAPPSRLADLSEAVGRLFYNGALAGSQRVDGLDLSPLQALAWFLNRAPALGIDARAGDVVLLGAIVAPVRINEAGAVRAEVDGLPDVEAMLA